MATTILPTYPLGTVVRLALNSEYDIDEDSRLIVILGECDGENYPVLSLGYGTSTVSCYGELPLELLQGSVAVPDLMFKKSLHT